MSNAAADAMSLAIHSLTPPPSTISPPSPSASVCVLGLGAAQKWSPRGPRRGAARRVGSLGTCGPGLQIWPTCAIIPSLKMTRVNSCHQISLKSFPKSLQVCRINIEVRTICHELSYRGVFKNRLTRSHARLLFAKDVESFAIFTCGGLARRSRSAPCSSSPWETNGLFG